MSLLPAGASLAGEMATQCPRASRYRSGPETHLQLCLHGFCSSPQTACLWQICPGVGGLCMVQSSGLQGVGSPDSLPPCRPDLGLASFPPFWSPCLPHTPTKAMSWKSSWGRGQEVTRWGPGQGQADIGRRLVQGVARHRGQRIHTGPRGQQEELLLPELVSGPLPHVPEPLLPLSWCCVLGAWPERLGRGAGTLRLGRWLPVKPGLPNKEQLLRSGGGGGEGIWITLWGPPQSPARGRPAP